LRGRIDLNFNNIGPWRLRSSKVSALLCMDRARESAMAEESSRRQAAGRSIGSSATAESAPITFLLTDIESSTRLWEKQPHVMLEALARHDQILQSIVSRNRGRIVKARGEGDSIFSVFSAPLDAATAAREAQRALSVESWPGGITLRVRMAIHTGLATERFADYYGPAVNRCARIRDLAHGGQVLVSGSTAEAVRSLLGPEETLRFLGEVRLRDITQSEFVHQLCHPDLLSTFPPLRNTMRVRQGHVPAVTSRFYGRERELADLGRRLDGHRLVTVVGPGGVGKTRLVIEGSRTSQGQFSGGVFYVDLTPVTSDDSVGLAIAGAVDISGADGGDLPQALGARLARTHALIILDNCEQVLPGVQRWIHVLLGIENVRVLTTSREPLGVSGEALFPLKPLAVASNDSHSEYGPAVALFLDRAKLLHPGFRREISDVAAVERICRRVDGLPLAIELAAGRTLTLSPAQIDTMLSKSMSLLRSTQPVDGHSRGRHNSVDELVSWSYSLLDSSDQALFRRLSVFAGAFDHAAAAAVTADDGADEFMVLEQIDRLVRRSLLTADPLSAMPYRMLETIRAFARSQAHDASEWEWLCRRHADYLMSAMTGLDPMSPNPGAIDVASTMLDDVRETVSWLLDHDCAEDALVTTWRSQRLWRRTGLLAEGHHWHSRALTVANNLQETAEYAYVLIARSELACRANSLGDARRDAQAALKIGEALGDAWIMLHAHYNLFFARAYSGEQQALEHHRAAVTTLAEQIGSGYARTISAWLNAESARMQEDLEQTEELLRQACLDSGSADPDLQVAAQVNLGEVLFDLGRLSDAERELVVAESQARRLGNDLVLTWAVWGRASIALAFDNIELAAELLDVALTLASRSSTQLAELLVPCAYLACKREMPDDALQLLRGADLLRAEHERAQWGAEQQRRSVMEFVQGLFADAAPIDTDPRALLATARRITGASQRDAAPAESINR
jgi:predicted ATPase/class 3 adenylate cyclase